MNLIILGMTMLQYATTSTTGIPANTTLAQRNKRREDTPLQILIDDEYKLSGLELIKKAHINQIGSTFDDIQNVLTQTIFRSSLEQFNNDCIQYNHFLGQNKELAKRYFSRAINKILELKPLSLVLSLTDSESIYFRFNVRPSYDISMEVFYTYDNQDQDDVEVTARIFNGGTKLKPSLMGGLDEVFYKINDIVFKHDTSTANVENHREEYLAEV